MTKTLTERALLHVLCGGLLLMGSSRLEAQALTDASEQHADTQPSTGKPSARARAEARDAYVAGARALDHGNLEPAEVAFEKAVSLDPGNTDYAIGRQLVLEHRVTALVQRAGQARSAGNTAQAQTLLAEATKLDPQNEMVLQHTAAAPLTKLFAPIADAGAQLQTGSNAEASANIDGELQLSPAPGLRSIHAHADTRAVVSQAFSAWGIRAVFDDSVVPQDLRLDLDDVSFAQAAPLVLQMGRLYAVPLSSGSVLIAKDSVDVRTRLERQLQETIYLPGYGTEQLNEINNVLRNVFDIKQLAIQVSAGGLLVRAPAETMHAVNLTLADLIDGGSEVSLELRLYAIDRSRTRSIGPQLPQQFGVYNVASAAQSLVSANQAVVDQAIAQGAITLTGNPITDLVREAVFLIASGLAQSSLLTDTLGFFGNGLTLTGVTTGAASFNLAFNSSDSRELEDVQLRASDRKEAVFRAGTRYPITTSTYSTGLTSASSSALAGVTINGVSASSLLNQYLGSNAGATVPQIQYEDLGITVKATPNVQQSGEVKMHLDLKIEALSGAALNNIPVLANRQFVSDITTPDGETAVMVSTLTRQETLAISGTPGLGELPGFQSATADRTSQQDTSELVLLITPHVVRRRRDTTAGPRIAFSPAPDQRD